MKKGHGNCFRGMWATEPECLTERSVRFRESPCVSVFCSSPALRINPYIRNELLIGCYGSSG